MLNKELDSLQNVLAVLNNYNHYETYIEVSPLLYIYLRQQSERLDNFYVTEYPETLYGCKIFLNPELEDYDYNIIRKETKHAE